jgi:hypothetical protein
MKQRKCGQYFYSEKETPTRKPDIQRNMRNMSARQKIAPF